MTVTPPSYLGTLNVVTQVAAFSRAVNQCTGLRNFTVAVYFPDNAVDGSRFTKELPPYRSRPPHRADPGSRA